MVCCIAFISCKTTIGTTFRVAYLNRKKLNSYRITLLFVCLSVAVNGINLKFELKEPKNLASESMSKKYGNELFNGNGRNASPKKQFFAN